MSEESRPSSKKKYVRLLWLAPLAVVLIILYINFLPLGGSPEHRIDVGGNDLSGKARLSGNASGFSEAMSNGSVTYREITGDTVYFELTDPRLSQADEVAVAVRFADNFPEDGIFVIGAQCEEGYSLRYAYVPFYGQLVDLPLVTQNGSMMVYATDTENPPPLSTVMDPLGNPPLGSLIASGDPSLDINQVVTLQEYVNTQFGDYDAGAGLSALLPDPRAAYAPLDGGAALLGAQEFYLYSNGGEFELTVEKRDLNRIAGLDNINVSLYAPDGTLAVSEVIFDDFNFTDSKMLGQKQRCHINMEQSDRGVYRLAVAPQGEEIDFIITNIAYNQGKAIAADGLYLAGYSYEGGNTAAAEAWLYLAAPGEIRFSSPGEQVPQYVTVWGDEMRLETYVNESGTWYTSGALEPGLYRLRSSLGDVALEATGALISLTEESLFIPSFNTVEEGKGWLDINISLKGSHTFWTFVDNGVLELSVTKQDLNQDEGADALSIEIYDLAGDLTANASIADDGDASAGGEPGPMQGASLTASNLSTGAYRIEMTGEDLLIRQISINQGKLVLDDSITPAPADTGYTSNAGAPADALALYTQGLSLQRAEFSCDDASGIQQAAVIGDGFYAGLYIDEMDKPFAVNLAPGSYMIVTARQNLTLEFNGYMSFTPDSFFLPRRCEVAGLETYVSDFKEYVDYIVVNYDGYYVTDSYDGWTTARARWKTEDLSIVDDTLSFCLMVPHLDLAADADKTIPVDSIVIELEIPPVWK
ncbi:MAG: hypothetical protein WC562_02175 [Dehalococcoidia bacterium]